MPGAGGPSRSARGVWRWALAALLVAVLCWTPPAIDQITGNPGNLTAISRTVSANRSTVGATVGWRAVVLAVGIRPWWLTDPASPWERKNQVRTAPSAIATVSTVLALCALLVVAGVGLLRRRVELWAGALIALAMCGSLAAVAAATPTTRLLSATLGYTLWWGSPAGMFVWVMLASVPAAALSRRGLPGGLRPVVASAAGVAVVALCGVAVAAAERPDEHLAEYRPLGTVSRSLDHSVPGGRTVLLLGSLGNSTFRFKMGARFALVRRGVRPLSPGTDTRLGSWYELDHHRYDCTVDLEDGNARPHRGAVQLASFTYNRSFPVSVWMWPAGCPSGAAAVGALGATPAQAYPETWVSYPKLLAQVKSGPLIRAIINPLRGDVEIKFRNLDEWHAYYPAGAQPALARLLYARHIRVIFVSRHPKRASKPATVHHHLRYIAAGVIGALAVLGAGAFLYRRRRRLMELGRRL